MYANQSPRVQSFTLTRNRSSVEGWLQGEAVEPLIVIAPNSFLRRLVYQEIRSKCV